MNNSRFRQRNREEEYVSGPEDATPWHILKQGTGDPSFGRNVEDLSDDDEAGYMRRQKNLKARDENYRKFLIEESKREAAKWDEFSDTEYPDNPKSEKAKSNRKRKRGQSPPVDGDKKTTKADAAVDNEINEEPEAAPVNVPKFKAAKEPKKARPKLLKKRKNSEKEATAVADSPSSPPKKKKNPKKEPAAAAPPSSPPKKMKKNPEKEPAAAVVAAPSKTLILAGIGNPALTCLGCRESGHRLKNCPKFRTNICIRCGESNHKYQECPSKGGDFKFATCFVCKEVGHLSKQCPKNAHGVYPNGGACRYCNSTDHLAQDCRRQKRDNRKPGGRFQGKKKGNFQKPKFNFQNKKRKV